MRDEAFLATQREQSLFAADWTGKSEALRALFEGASVLVIGGAGSIGAATVRRLLNLGPKRIHVIDIDENGLARLTRSIMAEGRPTAEIFYLAADFGGYPTRAHLETAGPFDVVLDFAAVKHVRSEKTLPALLHMLDVNVVRQDSFFRMLSETAPPRRLFAVSTDKAADPANFMGATKRLLEEVLYRAGTRGAAISTSSARFANVAFSAGSLLESFGLRMAAGRPLSAPENTRRFFISADEAAQICLLGAACCPPGMAVIPRPTPDLPPTELADVAGRFVESTGQRAVFLHDFAEAEAHLREGRDGYPIVLTPLDTVGEKDEEIFVGHGEQEVEIGMDRLLGVRAEATDAATLDAVLAELHAKTTGAVATTAFSEIETLIRRVVTNFRRTGGTLNLDDRV